MSGAWLGAWCVAWDFQGLTTRSCCKIRICQAPDVSYLPILWLVLYRLLLYNEREEDLRRIEFYLLGKIKWSGSVAGVEKKVTIVKNVIVIFHCIHLNHHQLMVLCSFILLSNFEFIFHILFLITWHNINCWLSSYTCITKNGESWMLNCLSVFF